MSFLLQIYCIPNTVARKPAPTPGFKLKRGKLIQSSKFIGWKSSRHERASFLQQSCSVGLTLSYLLLNVPLFPVNSSVSMAFQYLGFTKAPNEHVYMFKFFVESYFPNLQFQLDVSLVNESIHTTISQFKNTDTKKMRR